MGRSSDASRFLLPPLPVPEKANSLIRYSVVLTVDDGVEVADASVNIKPQPGDPLLTFDVRSS